MVFYEEAFSTICVGEALHPTSAEEEKVSEKLAVLGWELSVF